LVVFKSKIQKQEEKDITWSKLVFLHRTIFQTSPKLHGHFEKLTLD